ncbi:MAG TPA: hypothetical protein VF794_07795 [Archangium sp.]|jgi:hypothetical protein|uniref:hypothetical protein n=1 Tax=Archangium sp. TaxID=1872627 RepID=UPI002ED9B1FD
MVRRTAKAINREIPPTNLLFDLRNPRLDPQASQRDALRTLVQNLRDKIVNLAEDIVDHRLDPSSLTIVSPDERDDKLFVVLEGNRRLAALRLLENPDLAADLLERNAQKRLSALAKRYAADPVGTVSCVVFEDRDDARHWIQLRHRGEQSGRGIVSWDATQATRFEQSTGTDSRNAPALHLIDLVRRSGRLDESTMSKLDSIPITTVQRILNDPSVRQRLGISIENGQLCSDLTDGEVLKGFIRVVTDAAHGRLPVSVVDTKKDRAKYLDTFKDTEVPSPAAPRGERKVLTAIAASTGSSPAPKKRTKQSTQDRKYVIPGSCKLSIGNAKANNIFLELKRLPADQFPNAAGVLFRVFLEISVDVYIIDKKLKTNVELDQLKLKQKIVIVADHLEGQRLMVKRELASARRTTDPNHFVASSLDTLHSYIHATNFTPTPTDLKTGWDNLELFFRKLWE